MRESERDGFLRRRENRGFVAEKRRRRGEHRGATDSDGTRHGLVLTHLRELELED